MTAPRNIPGGDTRQQRPSGNNNFEKTEKRRRVPTCNGRWEGTMLEMLALGDGGRLGASRESKLSRIGVATTPEAYFGHNNGSAW